MQWIIPRREWPDHCLGIPRLKLLHDMSERCGVGSPRNKAAALRCPGDFEGNRLV
jgi:hypothetical protein